MTDPQYVVTRIGQKGVRIKMIRKDDDVVEIDGEQMTVLRASIGGTEEHGFYLTFRGDPEKVAEMVKMISYAAGEMLKAGRYYDERGQPPYDQEVDTAADKEPSEEEWKAQQEATMEERLSNAPDFDPGEEEE